MLPLITVSLTRFPNSLHIPIHLGTSLQRAACTLTTANHLQDRFLDGIEDMPSVLKTLIQAQPDVIQLTLGQAKNMLAAGVEAGCRLPALVVRTDVSPRVRSFGNYCVLDKPITRILS